MVFKFTLNVGDEVIEHFEDIEDEEFQDSELDFEQYIEQRWMEWVCNQFTGGWVEVR